MTLFTEIVERSEAQKEDSAWFQSHPSRSHRFRVTTPEEQVELADCVPPGGEITHVVVRQLEPGFNVRKPMNLNPTKGYMGDVLLGGFGEDDLKMDLLLSELFENNEILRGLDPIVNRALEKFRLAGRA